MRPELFAPRKSEGGKNKKAYIAVSLFERFRIGSPGRARTADPVINSHLLYRLSYRGIM
jgi:hypothetical protein